MLEFNDEQVAQLDKVHCAVSELMCTMLGKFYNHKYHDEIIYNAAFTSPIAEFVANMLKDAGYMVHYPTRIDDGENVEIFDEYV